MIELSEAETAAIDWLRSKGGCLLVSDVEDKNCREIVFGGPIPGKTIFKKLEKKGLVFFTEAEPTVFDDGTEFTFTAEIYLEEDWDARIKQIVP